MGTHDVVNWPLFDWLRMPGFVVSVGVRIDHLSLQLLGLTTLVLLVVLTVWPKRVSHGWLGVAWLGVAMAIVAGNLGQWFFGWTLSAWASSELARRGREYAATFRPVWLVQRVSDLALLGGIGLVWLNFDASLEFSAWTAEAIGTLRPELIESIALCVLIGVIGRCAQVPMTVWLETEAGFASQRGRSMTKLSDEMVGLWNVPDGHQVAERLKSDPRNRWHRLDGDAVAPAVLAWWFGAAFLPIGVSLLVRFEPLISLAEHTRMLMVAVGAFTLLTCSANAVAQNNGPRVLSQLAVGQCGLMLVAMGLGQPAAVASGLAMFLWQSLAFALLLAANGRKSRGLTVVFLSLAAGFWGRHSLLNVVWSRAWPEPSDLDAASMVLGAAESSVWPMVAVMLSLAELLTSLALLRAWFLQHREPTADEPVSEFVAWTQRLFVGTLIVGGIAFDVVRESARPPLMGVSPLMLLSLTGMVLAWVLYARPSELPAKAVAALGPFARLSRNRFYVDDLAYLLFVHPVTAIGEWLSWLDERLFARVWRAARSGCATFVGAATDSMTAGSPKVGALAAVGSVVVLAWMLMWLRS